jgi:hypothetical protein
LNCGQYETAERQLREAVAVRERLHGADHPSLLPLHVNLAQAQLGQSHVEDAIASIDRVLAVLAKVDSPESFGAPYFKPYAIAGTAVARALEVAQAVSDSGERRVRLTHLATVAGKCLPPDHVLHERIAAALAGG